MKALKRLFSNIKILPPPKSLCCHCHTYQRLVIKYSWYNTITIYCPGCNAFDEIERT